jgi:hypothetical protein
MPNKETDAALALRVVWRVMALVAFVFLTFILVASVAQSRFPARAVAG